MRVGKRVTDSPLTPGRVVLSGAALALVAVGARTSLAVLGNLPFDPVSVPAGARGAVALATPVALGVALLAVGLASSLQGVRVGFAFAGVFGVLSLAGGATTLPVIVAVTVGAGLALSETFHRRGGYLDARRAAIAGAFVASVAISLASTAGVVDGGLRSVGGLLAVLGVAAVGVRAERDRVGLLVGALAFAGVVLGSTASPFVAGSALLVGFAVVGVPHVLVALAVGGAAAAGVAGVRRGEYPLALGVVILLLAGVPATPSQAMGVVLGATLALVGDRPLTAPPTETGREVDS